MGRIAGDRSAWSASGSQKQFEPQKSLIKDITAGGGHGVSGNGAASACAQSKELEENAMGWLQGNPFVAAWKCRPEKPATTTTKIGKRKQRNMGILYCTSSLRPHATYVLSDRW
jgi:hypothetical protein